MALRHDAVFMNAGSYVIRPPSPSSTPIWRRSGARIVPSTIGSVYSRPVRLSVIVRVSDGKVVPRGLGWGARKLSAPADRWRGRGEIVVFHVFRAVRQAPGAVR